MPEKRRWNAIAISLLCLTLLAIYYQDAIRNSLSRVSLSPLLGGQPKPASIPGPLTNMGPAAPADVLARGVGGVVVDEPIDEPVSDSAVSDCEAP